MRQNSKNLQLLDNLACNTANKPATFRFLKDALVMKLSGKMCQGGLIFSL